MRTITLKEIEDAIKKVAKDYPFPKHIGGNLWRITPNCIGNSKFLEELDKKLFEQLKGKKRFKRTSYERN